MIPTVTFDYSPSAAADDQPRYFLNDAYDAAADDDWLLDLGSVNVPPASV